MDGSKGRPITHATWQRVALEGSNGWRTYTIKYLVADIPEEFVLGMTWLQYANPVVDWKQKKITWQDKAKRARQRIIQSDIRTNEPPSWVEKEFPSIFKDQTKTLPRKRGTLDYHIELKPGFKPQRDKNRAFTPEENREFQKLAEQELKSGRWRFSNSPQAAQMLWAAKAGGKKRPCHDYRYINRWIVDDAFPVPLVKELMTDVAAKRWLTSLDIPKAYNEIRIADTKTEDLLSFYCNKALYAPRVVQFGSKTAVAHFQRFITTILQNEIGKGCYAYLDNIIIYHDTEKEHDNAIRRVLQALTNNHLNVRKEKCEWKKQEVQFCGFLVGNGRIRFDPAKIAAIRDWKPPQTGSLAKRQLREFLGFCNFYRDGIPQYSEIAAPLTRLTSPKVKWHWGPAENRAWNALKATAMTAPVRTAYNEKLPIEIFTDASKNAIAGTIEHRFTCGHKQPIVFYSKKLNPAERNYATHDKELLAIVKTLQQFRGILAGAPGGIKIWSDHRALTHFLRKTKLTERHARWATLLSEYSFKIHHIKGKDNIAADALSRKNWEHPEIPEQRLLKENQFSK